MALNGTTHSIGQEGFAQLAHAIRRVGALYIATMICEPGTSDDDLFRRADKMATWIRGSAQPGQPGDPGFIGENPWGQ